MAIMKALFAASVLASLTSAVPVPGIDRRAVVMNTVTHTTWTTVDVTTTVYVNDADPTPPPQAPASSVSSVPAPPAAAPETSSSADTPAVSPAAFAQEPPSSAAPAYTPPVETSAPAPAYTPPVEPSAPAPAYNPPVEPSAPAPAPAPSSTADASPKPSTGGPCEGESNACTGDITYYNGDGGYGSCGTIIDDNANTLALPVGLMGSVSNGNPYCGRTVSIKGTDGSIHTGTVADKCMGCYGDSIDLTPALFKAVAPNGDGRVSGIVWFFSD